VAGNWDGWSCLSPGRAFIFMRGVAVRSLHSLCRSRLVCSKNDIQKETCTVGES